jgi:hypothetical protein
MKNKIEFPENDIIQPRQFITSAGSSFDQNQYPKAEQKKKVKPSKIIKGKVKIYNSNNEVKLIDNDWLDDEAELEIVSKRMSIFLKFTFLFLIVLSFLIMFKKDVL